MRGTTSVILTSEWNHFAIGQVTSSAGADDGIVNDMEKSLIRELVSQYGWEWSVRIEMLLMIGITIVFTVMMCILLFSWIFQRRFHDTSFRFSDKMNGFAYVFIEKDNMKELVVRKPKSKSLFEGLELTIAIWYSFIFKNKPIQESTIRTVAIFLAIFIVIFAILMYFVLVFSFNILEGQKFRLNF